MDEKTGSGEETIIAVTSTGPEMDSPMDPRFGRCTYFAIIDPSGNMKPVANGAQSLGNGAGIEAAKQVSDLKVGTVITGNVGPNAFRVLAAAGIKVFVCGEMAHEPVATMLLIGFGIDGLSMAPGGLPESKQLIRQISLADAQQVAREALLQSTAEGVRSFVRDAYSKQGILTA